MGGWVGGREGRGDVGWRGGIFIIHTYVQSQSSVVSRQGTEVAAVQSINQPVSTADWILFFQAFAFVFIRLVCALREGDFYEF